MRSKIKQNFDDICSIRADFGDKTLTPSSQKTPNQAFKLDIQGELIRLEP